MGRSATDVFGRVEAVLERRWKATVLVVGRGLHGVYLLPLPGPPGGEGEDIEGVGTDK